MLTLRLPQIPLLLLGTAVLLGNTSGHADTSSEATPPTPIAERQGQVYADPHTGTFWALFGYDNPSGQTVSLDANTVSRLDGTVIGIFANTPRDTIDLSQPLDAPPTELLPGRQEGVFWVNFDRHVTWTLGEAYATATLTSDQKGAVTYAQDVEQAIEGLFGGVGGVSPGSHSGGPDGGPPPAGDPPLPEPPFEPPTAVPSPAAGLAGGALLVALICRRRRAVPQG